MSLRLFTILIQKTGLDINTCKYRPLFIRCYLLRPTITLLYFVVVQFVLVSRSTAHCGGIIRLNDKILNYRHYRSTVNAEKDDIRLTAGLGRYKIPLRRADGNR